MNMIMMNNKILMNKNMNFMLYFMLCLGTIITINSSSWLSAWMGLEMNMMSFIPLMMNNKTYLKSSNSMMMYFIIQSISSSIMIMSMMNMKMMMNLKLFMESTMMMSLMMKIGAAPFYWWMPKIMNNLNWMNCMILMTWQKIAPIMLMLQINTTKSLVYLSALLSTLIGSIMSLNQNSLKMIMSYSSINHVGWIMLSMLMNLKLMMTYFLFYSIINLIICLNLNKYNIIYTNQLFKINNNKMYKLIMNSLFLSLGGIPPFMGFLPKLLIMIIMIKNNMIIEASIMIILAVILVSVYMNPFISSLLTNKMNIKWMFKINKSMMSYKLNFYTFNLMMMLMLSMWIMSKMI
uniref:NADH dehydrogenase subunit 2 n=1 Tax=Hypsathalia przewalskyi TaxID=1428813 RepID=UPI0021FDFB36|nr:NADH dehydrogenase subunit 2 [Hypsathalia przewalskyi]UXW93425.1 NADH dehydrogenase subunit 2 [Hypsathalia przewalskyi]